MPKPMYVWSGSAWVSVATEVESLATYATQSYADSATGSKLVVPSSVAVGSGTGSVATQGTVSFSGASSVSLNNCFSSTYTNYLIRFSNIVMDSSTQRELQFRLRVSNADNSTASSYIGEGLYGFNVTAGAEYLAQDKAFLINSNNGAAVNGEIKVHNPFTTDKTGIDSYASGYRTDLTNNYWSYYRTGIHNQSVSYTGFTIISGTGTMTGTVSVYGYKAG